MLTASESMETIPALLHITASFTLNNLCGAQHKLWISTIAAAEDKSADLKVSRGVTMDWLRLPIEMTSMQISLFLPSR
jgi:hypothetical protein